MTSQVPCLVSAVVSESVFRADLGGDGELTHEVVSSGVGVEVHVEPSNWWVEAHGREFISVRSRGIRIIAFAVVVSSRVLWVSSEVGRGVRVVEVDADVSGSFWDPDSHVRFSEGGVPVGSVWEGDGGVWLASRGRASSVDGELVGVSASGHGGGDGVSARFSVVERRRISSEGNVNPVSRSNESRVGSRSWVEIFGLNVGFREVSIDGFSAREVFSRVFGPFASARNVISVDVISDISSASWSSRLSLSENERQSFDVFRDPQSVEVLWPFRSIRG